MKMTKKLLLEKGACEDKIKWFEQHFPALDADYQEVLNELAKNNELSYAEWLLQNIGATNDVLEIKEIVSESSFFFAGEIRVLGKIEVRFSIKSGRNIEAGRGINVGGDISAGGNIKAKWSINAGNNIKAGDSIEAGCSINAGGNIKASNVKAVEDIEVGGNINASNIKAGGSIKSEKDKNV